MPVTRRDNLGEIVKKHPKAAEIMSGYGLHCIGCMVAHYESLEDGCRAHGMDDEKIDKMVDEINADVENSEAK